MKVAAEAVDVADIGHSDQAVRLLVLPSARNPWSAARVRHSERAFVRPEAACAFGSLRRHDRFKKANEGRSPGAYDAPDANQVKTEVLVNDPMPKSDDPAPRNLRISRSEVVGHLACGLGDAFQRLRNRVLVQGINV